MVKRTDRHSFKHLLFVAFALIVMITSWESNRTNAAVISPTIPEESIRLRILANSDSAQDQALKREIRDAIIERMQGWVVGPHSLDEARAVVLAHLPEFDELVGQMIEARGYSYTHTVELGKVPFPTKMYGNEVYPAGDYEALRVTIGSGEGQNWWCVLFPPLCFVDSVSGEAVATAAVVAKTEGQDKMKTSTTPAPAAKDSKAAQPMVKQKASMEAQAQPVLADATEDAQPKVKFFFWEMTKKIVSWFS
ncbi:stage II sporulation protein R [Paenibacillus chondroitinus]|uniref:Stage II sporulation protein R n=1 Tax=Paenibacillus chondroitinus TaxID=59842 RepID=A0ABU6DI49_9BACL|nr:MULTISPECIES: stage II sporulation protein R [Paenibacillus]MCY9660428.1 stage II sporulation protein R [Paenibacillus anseongense]MEB4797440.1 stage II sporulation protein R [Paenibacillus chondroitinus]